MKHLVILILFILPAQWLNAQNSIEGYEYWFDTDYENRVVTPVAPVDVLDLNLSLAADDLNVGVHTFNFRSWDSEMVFSSVLSQFFFKTPPSSGVTDPTILSYQYWLDNDFENAALVNTALQPVVSVNELIDVDNLNVGVHTFTIRFRDNSGMWSSPLSQFFYKVPAQIANEPEILEYQYWIDNDYENAVLVSTPAQALVSIDELIGADDLNVGVHTFTIRFKDNSGLWSSPLSHFFYKVPETATDNQMVAYRYWFNEAFEAAVEVTLDEPVQQLDLIESIDLTGLPQGDYTVHFQFKDDSDLWSVVTTDSVTKLPFPQAFFEFNFNDNCDSTTVTFTNNSVDANAYLWDFGDGDTSSLQSPQHVYYGPTQFTVTLTVTDTVSGIESTISQELFIPGNTFFEFDVTECAEYASPDGQETWTESGVYTDTIANSLGCDSVITVNLTILNTTAAFDTTACFSYTAPDGELYTQSGMVTAIIDNAAGCDSIISIDLTVIDIDLTVTQDQTVLTALQPGASYQWLDCNNGFELIDGATDAVYTAVANGEYAVEITLDGCSAVSPCYAVTSVGVSGNLFNELQLFPNPTRGDFTLTVGKVYSELLIEVSDSYGRLVDRKSFVQQDRVNWTLDGAPGVYFIRVSADGHFAVIRLVKQ